MLEIDVDKLDQSVSEFRSRQAKLVTAVAFLLVKAGGLGVAEALMALGIKPTKKWVKAVTSFDDGDFGLEK